MRDFQSASRSPVRGTNGMAATSHPLATLAAIEMLRSGGNAIDAAVTAAAVQAVVEPQSTGIGGDCFVLLAPKGSAEIKAFNGSGRAPAGATIDWFKSRGYASVPEQGALSVTIPGAIDAWDRLLASYGKKGLDAALAPAIHYAEHGYVVHDRVAFDWKRAVPILKSHGETARIFLKNGLPFEVGDIHRQHQLAHTLRLIAKHGSKGFYSGEVAEDIVETLQEAGGLHSLDDFLSVAGSEMQTVSCGYRGFGIHQLPPNNQGLTGLLMLNILSGFELSKLDPLGAERLHLEIEAGRLAYRDRDRFIADPSFSDVPVERLLSPAYADQLRRSIAPGKSMTNLPQSVMARGDTVYISVVDKDQNVVSFINSTFHSFGSGITSKKSGVVLQNRGASFRLDPEHPNALAPGKRPMHTIMPGMAARGNKCILSFGVMGGDYQPFGHAHVLTNLFDHQMDVQEAIDCPRVFYENGSIVAEAGVPQSTVSELERFGHKVSLANEPLGGGQAVLIDWDRGTLTGASDPRKDGCALGF
jgi:gamma-glutamyltranspeptidase/glutathione hydrolase